VIAFVQGRGFPELASPYPEDAPAASPTSSPSRQDRRSRDLSRTLGSFVSLAATRGWISCEGANAIQRVLEPVNGRDTRPPIGIVYERLMAHPSLDQREAAILYLLAHGLGVAELVKLAPEDIDLDHAHVNIAGPQRRRVVPITARAVEKIRPWVSKRRVFGSSFLFPSSRTEALSPRSIRHIVKRVVRRIYPDEPHIADAVHPGGFRSLFIRRALDRRVSIGALQGLTGLSRHSLIDLCLAEAPSMPTLRRELNRMTRTSTRWI
jgi:integrase